MAYADFPQLGSYLTAEQDIRFYDVEYEDPTEKTEFHGGYEATRPGHVRTALRRIFKTGWSNLTKTDREALEQLYKDVKAGSNIWVWVNPWDDYMGPYAQVAGDTFVRFATRLRFTPVSLGPVTLYECEITLKEV